MEENLCEEGLKPAEQLPETACTESAAAEAEVDENGNLAICPNCLEPNPEGLAVCRYCGMPLHPGAENIGEAPADEASMAQSREEAVPAPEAEKSGKKEKEERGFHKYMPYLGLYIIYYAVTEAISISQREDITNLMLAYFSCVVYLAAGILMAWPLIKKGWQKIHPSAVKPEEENAAELSEEAETQDTEPAGELNEPESEAEELHEETPDEAA